MVDRGKVEGSRLKAGGAERRRMLRRAWRLVRLVAGLIWSAGAAIS